MKLRITLFASVCIVIASSCTTSLPIKVMHPAQINLPKEIKTVAVVDRSIVDDDNRVGNILEGLITGEGIMADKYGAENSMKGLELIATESPRLELATGAPIRIKAKGMGLTNNEIPWPIVDSICKERGADAIVVLEAFDSNDFGSVLGQPVTVAKPGMTVKASWRIYYPAKKEVVDHFTDYTTWNNNNPYYTPNIFDPIPQGNRVTAQAGYAAGIDYGRRIAASFYHENRLIHTSGNDAMKVGYRSATAGNWDAAKTTWRSQLEKDVKKKVRKRASLNLAVAYEMTDNLTLAREMAQHSYEVYGNKHALGYMHVLEQRIAEQPILKEQLGDSLSGIN
jgi:hypothetical protein